MMTGMMMGPMFMFFCLLALFTIIFGAVFLGVVTGNKKKES